MNCTPKYLIEESKCYDCIPAGTHSAVQAMLACEWSEGGAGPCDDPVVLDWLQRLADDFQPMPSQDTVRAVCDFCTALRIAGIMDKMLVVNTIIPDSFLAMRYPLIYQVGNGNSPFINVNFTAPYLNQDGLLNDGGISFMHMDTGFVPNVHWASTESCGLSVYESVTEAIVNPDQTDIGVYSDTDGGSLMLIRSFNDGAGQTEAYAWDIANLCAAVKADTPAFYSFNRVAINLAQLWMENTTTGGLLFLDDDNNDQSLVPIPDKSMYFMTMNDNGVPNNYTSRRISFMAIHEGLTQAEVHQLYLAVYNLRFAFGGGYS